MERGRDGSKNRGHGVNLDGKRQWGNRIDHAGGGEKKLPNQGGVRETRGDADQQEKNGKSNQTFFNSEFDPTKDGHNVWGGRRTQQLHGWLREFGRGEPVVNKSNMRGLSSVT